MGVPFGHTRPQWILPHGGTVLVDGDHLRFNWMDANLAALDPAEAREFVVDAWRMVVPKKLSRAHDLAHPDGPG